MKIAVDTEKKQRISYQHEEKRGTLVPLLLQDEVLESEFNDSSFSALSSNSHHTAPDPSDNVSLSSESTESEIESETDDLSSLGVT